MGLILKKNIKNTLGTLGTAMKNLIIPAKNSFSGAYKGEKIAKLCYVIV